MTNKQIVDSLASTYEVLVKDLLHRKATIKQEGSGYYWDGIGSNPGIEIVTGQIHNLGYLEGYKSAILEMIRMHGYELKRLKNGTYRAIKRKEE